MDIRVALAFLVFSLSMNLVGIWAGIDTFDNRVDLDEVQNDLQFESPDFTYNGTNGDTFDAINAAVSGFGELFSEALESFLAVLSLLKLAIPPITEVFWFNFLVWLPIGFGILLGLANWARGK